MATDLCVNQIGLSPQSRVSIDIRNDEMYYAIQPRIHIQTMQEASQLIRLPIITSQQAEIRLSVKGELHDIYRTDRTLHTGAQYQGSTMRIM